MRDDSNLAFQASGWRAATTIRFSDYALPEFMRRAAEFGTDSFGFVVTPNADHLIRYCDDASFRDIYRTADFVLLDSRFLSLILRVTMLLRVEACPGSDITATLLAGVVQPDDKIVVIGGTERQMEILRETYNLNALVHMSPPMGFITDPDAVDACLRFVETHSPFRFCLLAVGCPQQERLAHALKARERARGLALCVGASINFLTGGERRAPLWVQKIGFEWLYRLTHDPRRLAMRYLVRGPRIFMLLPRLKIVVRSTPTLAPELPQG